jgi:hypothetical protein
LATTAAALLVPVAPGSLVSPPLLVVSPPPLLVLEPPLGLVLPLLPPMPVAFGLDEQPNTNPSVAPTAKHLEKLIMGGMLTPSRPVGEAYWFGFFFCAAERNIESAHSVAL